MSLHPLLLRKDIRVSALKMQKDVRSTDKANYTDFPIAYPDTVSTAFYHITMETPLVYRDIRTPFFPADSVFFEYRWPSLSIPFPGDLHTVNPSVIGHHFP